MSDCDINYSCYGSLEAFERSCMLRMISCELKEVGIEYITNFYDDNYEFRKNGETIFTINTRMDVKEFRNKLFTFANEQLTQISPT